MGTDSETKDSEARDTVRAATDATVDHLGRIASIVATAVRDIATEIGKWADDVAASRTTPAPEPVPVKPEDSPFATEVKPAEKPGE
jgi:hypothetical protein